MGAGQVSGARDAGRRAAGDWDLREGPLALSYESPTRNPRPAPAMVDEAAVRKALRQVKDPEVGLNIMDLGLVYDVEVNQETGQVKVNMTLTSPGCPAGGQILGDTDQIVRSLEGVNDVEVELVWEPFWTPERIDPKVRAVLGF